MIVGLPRVELTALNVAGLVILPANGLHVFNTATAGNTPYWNCTQCTSLSAETSGQLLVMKTGFSMGLAIAEKNRLIEETVYYVPVRVTEDKALNETLKYEQGRSRVREVYA